MEMKSYQIDDHVLKISCYIFERPFFCLSVVASFPLTFFPCIENIFLGFQKISRCFINFSSSTNSRQPHEAVSRERRQHTMKKYDDEWRTERKWRKRAVKHFSTFQIIGVSFLDIFSYIRYDYFTNGLFASSQSFAFRSTTRTWQRCVVWRSVYVLVKVSTLNNDFLCLPCSVLLFTFSPIWNFSKNPKAFRTTSKKKRRENRKKKMEWIGSGFFFFLLCAHSALADSQHHFPTSSFDQTVHLLPFSKHFFLLLLLSLYYLCRRIIFNDDDDDDAHLSIYSILENCCKARECEIERWSVTDTKLQIHPQSKRVDSTKSMRKI